MGQSPGKFGWPGLGRGNENAGYAFILHDEKMMLARGMSWIQTNYALLSLALGKLVLSISSKSGGKNGTHCWVPEVSSIAAISYVLRTSTTFRILHWSPIPRCPPGTNLIAAQTIGTSSRYCLPMC
jgi:hypothetical protein